MLKQKQPRAALSETGAEVVEPPAPSAPKAALIGLLGPALVAGVAYLQPG